MRGGKCSPTDGQMSYISTLFIWPSEEQTVLSPRSDEGQFYSLHLTKWISNYSKSLGRWGTIVGYHMTRVNEYQSINESCCIAEWTSWLPLGFICIWTVWWETILDFPETFRLATEQVRKYNEIIHHFPSGQYYVAWVDAFQTKKTSF